MLVALQSLWKSCFINTKLAVGVPKVRIWLVGSKMAYRGISGLSLHLYPSCIYDPGVEQGILRRLSQVHGNHVFCLPPCPSGAEHTKHSSSMRTLPAHKPKDSGQRPHKAILQLWPSMQIANIEDLGKTYQYAWCAGACLSADFSFGHECCCLQLLCA